MHQAIEYSSKGVRNNACDEMFNHNNLRFGAELRLCVFKSGRSDDHTVTALWPSGRY